MRAAGMECGLEDIGTRGPGGVTPYCFVLNTLFEVSVCCNGSKCSWYYLFASDQLDYDHCLHNAGIHDRRMLLHLILLHWIFLC